ncbi:unnamed protein product [Chilo suppressalis]|uniref:Vitellogenin domain-containing protein n=1 Tax=Chilo suppressalis TaxID=168631 RepID=A0ABN8AWT7_CHISP|nr:unnamed protein product [Chilo suppressalis]
MKALIILVVNLIVVFRIVVSSSSVSRYDHGEVKLFETPVLYDVESTLFLNDISSTEKEVSYKIKAQLAIQPLWRDSNSEFLLKLQLLEPKLHLRGKHPNANFMAHPSVWDSHQDSSFYVHWKDGLIHNSYLDSKELPDIINYKKSLISLFQLQIIDGDFNETDISGPCNIFYESISPDVFRKIKRDCECDSGFSLGRARRVTRYTLQDGSLHAVHAEELLELGHSELGVKARSWHRLQRSASPAPVAVPAASTLEDALAAVPATLSPASLGLVETDTNEDQPSLPALVEQHRAALGGEEAGGGGEAAQAAAVLDLLPAVRAATVQQLQALLDDKDNYPILAGLCRVLGLSGTRASISAATSFLQLEGRAPLQPLAREFLAAAALAPVPGRGSDAELARVAGAARDPAVAAAALRAAACLAARLPAPAADNMRDLLVKGLARCKDDECRAVKVGALGELRRADTADILLEQAQRGARDLALAALEALRALHAASADADAATPTLHHARRQRLRDLALQPARPLEVRAAALDLLMISSASRPLQLVSVGAELVRNGPSELVRLYRGRLHALHLMQLQPNDNWGAHAPRGTSSVLTRDLGWGAGEWSARLESVQVASGGVLRRGVVDLAAVRAAGDDAGAGRGCDLLGVELWTRGMQGIVGNDDSAEPHLDEGEDEEEAVMGGISLSVLGRRLPPLRLFSSQTELLAHVWGGAGSEPTPVLRSVAALPPTGCRLPLLVGARLDLDWRAALATGIDAHAQVSLWSRSALGAVAVRAGVAGRVGARVRSAWGSLRAGARVWLEPRLYVRAHLDFYARAQLCLRLYTRSHDYSHVSELRSQLGGRQLTVFRQRNTTRHVPGRTLHVGRRAHDACAALPAADDDDDDHY